MTSFANLPAPANGPEWPYTIPAPASIDGYRAVLRIQAKGMGFWFGKCGNWYSCGSRNLTRIVADTYYPTYEVARKAGVSWGIGMCEHCYREMLRDYPDYVTLLLTREKVSLSKRHACNAVTMGGLPCSRDGIHYIVIAGKRRHFCVSHSAIHSVYTNVFRLDWRGMCVNVTEQQHTFYKNHRWAIR